VESFVLCNFAGYQTFLTHYIMGKGDKKTKRGKIIIGSAGVKRTRKQKNPAAAKPKSESTSAGESEAMLAQEAKAVKKAARKAEENAEGTDEKHKAAKAKKKTADTEAEVETAQEEPKQE